MKDAYVPKYVMVTIIVFVIVASLYNVLAGTSTSRKELYSVYDYGDVLVFRVNREVFNYIKDDFYVYIVLNKDDWFPYLLYLDRIELIAHRKNEMIMPAKYELKRIDLNVAEHYRESLENIIEYLTKHNYTYLVLSYSNKTNGKYVLYKIIAKFACISMLLDEKKIEGNISLFKEYIIKTLIEKRIVDLHPLAIIDSLLSRHGVYSYDVVRLVVMDDEGIKENIMVYLDNKNLSITFLKKIGEKVKDSSEHINTVMIFDQPWGPRNCYSDVCAFTSGKLYFALKDAIPCFSYVHRFRTLYLEYIELDYGCIADNIVKNNEEIEKSMNKFIDEVIFKLKNMREYGKLFTNYTWLIVIKAECAPVTEIAITA